MLIALISSCTTDFDVYAPEEDIFVVYGVLNPNDSVQYIRVAKAYQVEGNAYDYASENDLSREGLDVQIKGDGITYQGVAVTDIPKESPGIFLPSQTVYQFTTDGSPGNVIFYLTFDQAIRKTDYFCSKHRIDDLGLREVI